MKHETTYKDRRAFGDSCLDEAKAILADTFCTNISQIETASDELDCKEATDLLLPDGRRIAYRCRSSSYLSRYPNDITIRLDRRSGKSEWQKVQSGCVDFILYAFEDGGTLMAWKLINVAELLGCLRFDWETARKVCRPHTPQGQEPFMSIDLSGFNLSARAAVVVAEG